MRKLFVIVIIYSLIVSLSSCAGSRGGCYGTRGFIGYGHK